MSYEEALKAIDVLLEEHRVSGDTLAFEATMKMRKTILELIGIDVAKEYVKRYGMPRG